MRVLAAPKSQDPGVVLLGTLVDSGGELALAAAQLSDVTATLTAPATRPPPPVRPSRIVR